MSWLAHRFLRLTNMLIYTKCFSIRQLCASFLLLFFTCSVFSQATLSPPVSVSALVYSSTAAELFWTPTTDLVEVSRNGQVLGVYGSRSLFQATLNSSDSYRYELRTVDNKGAKSSAVIVSLSTRNFSLPIKRVQPIGQNNQVAPPPPEPESAVIEAPSTADVTTDEPALSDNEPQSESSASAITQTPDNCIARDTQGLLACVRNANAYRRIDFANDIQCDGNCCPNGGALLRFDNVQNLEVAGHGHRLLRSAGQRQCGLLDITNAANLQINGLRLDDDQQVSGCQVGDNCPRMVHIKSSSAISFTDSHISNGKGYAFYVQGTNGFRFERSSLHNSGVLGMYIGHGNDASSNVQILQSTFSDNQTNGLALLGVTGQSITSNLVAENLFVRNHRKGQFAVEPRYGSGFTGGGQLYIAEASDVTVRNNIVKDGYCDNCFVQRRNRSGVSGIELGRPNQRSLSNVEVSNNTMLNLDGFGISQNANSSLTQNVSILNNVLLNTTSGEQVTGARKSGNRILNTQNFDSFEDASDLGGRFQGAVNCSANGSVSRQCSGETLFGQCAVQLQLGSSDCDGAQVLLTGPKISISAGQTVVASGWVRSPVGQWCTVFRDASDRVISEECKNLHDVGISTVQPFVGMPTIEASAPGGSASVQLSVVHRQAGATMWLDDLKLSVSQ